MQLLNKCPICGGQLLLGKLCQYEIVTYLSKSGKETKMKKKIDLGPMDYAQIRCEHEDFYTNFDLEVEFPKWLNGQVKRINGQYFLDNDDE